MAPEKESPTSCDLAEPDLQRPWMYRTWVCAFVALLCLSAGSVVAIAIHYGINDGVMAAILLSLLLGLVAAATIR